MPSNTAGLPFSGRSFSLLSSMRINFFPIIFCAFLPCALAASHPKSYSDPIHVPILRHSNVFDRVAILPKVIDAIRHKYGFATTPISKRSGDARSGYIPLTAIVYHIQILPPLDGTQIIPYSKMAPVIQVS